jgi:two-component system OmpR family response regulator
MAESTVLVVDDEPLILAFLAENLRADDFTVLTAANGGEAIDALAASRPDVVLLDVVLPDMSGYDVCRRVRGGDAVNDPWDPDLPIISLGRPSTPTASAGSTGAPTATSRSRSTTRSCSPGSERS